MSMSEFNDLYLSGSLEIISGLQFSPPNGRGKQVTEVIIIPRNNRGTMVERFIIIELDWTGMKITQC